MTPNQQLFVFVVLTVLITILVIWVIVDIVIKHLENKYIGELLHREEAEKDFIIGSKTKTSCVSTVKKDDDGKITPRRLCVDQTELIEVEIPNNRVSRKNKTDYIADILTQRIQDIKKNRYDVAPRRAGSSVYGHMDTPGYVPTCKQPSMYLTSVKAIRGGDNKICSSDDYFDFKTNSPKVHMKRSGHAYSLPDCDSKW